MLHFCHALLVIPIFYNMKDDADFNITFVALIEKHPCLYDYTSSEYSKRNVQDKAWEAIAKETSESVQDCKERWKNLRGCYTRHLKASIGPSGSGNKIKKPYYLAEYLYFLQPFTKSRKSQGNIIVPSQTEISSPEPDQLQDEHDQGNDSENEEEYTQTRQDTPQSPENDDFVPPTPKRLKRTSKLPAVSITDVNKAALDYFSFKKASTTEKKSEDPDLAFLVSVLPDMREMNTAQKRCFKVGVLNLAVQILGENKPPVSPAVSSCSSSSSTATHSYYNDYQQPPQSAITNISGSAYSSNRSSGEIQQPQNELYTSGSINMGEFLQFGHRK